MAGDRGRGADRRPRAPAGGGRRAASRPAPGRPGTGPSSRACWMNPLILMILARQPCITKGSAKGGKPSWRPLSAGGADSQRKSICNSWGSKPRVLAILDGKHVTQRLRMSDRSCLMTRGTKRRTAPPTRRPVGGHRATATLGRGAGTQHADGTPVRVLVVDDEPSLAELLSSVLRYEGWSVQTAGTRGRGGQVGAGVPPGRGRARHHASRLRRRGGHAAAARRASGCLRALPDRQGRGGGPGGGADRRRRRLRDQAVQP